MEPVIGILLAIGAFAMMEGVAYISHKYVMHGFLWSLHESHHRKRHGRFEKNDWFAFMFAIPAFLCILFGELYAWPLTWIGAGITAYGAMYFVFHDVLVHQRLGHLRIPKSRYLRRIVQAHRYHHASEEKDGGVSFGFLYAPAARSLKAARR